MGVLNGARLGGNGPAPHATDVDVVVVGAGPVGLMLAAELRLAGATTLVLERRAAGEGAARAAGLAGQILEFLRYRGLLERFEAASAIAYPTPIFPFGEMHVDFTALEDPPLKGLVMPQSGTEDLLEQHVLALGGEVRRGHGLTTLDQDDAAVTAEVFGPDGAYRVRCRYLVGCDGGRSTVRKTNGMGFPGITYPEVNRLAEVTVPDGLAIHADGGLEIPGAGRFAPGFTRTARGLFAWAQLRGPGTVMLNTVELEETEYDDDELALDEFAASLRRVLGADVPLGEPRRLARFQWHARQAERVRDRRVFLAGDGAHLLPSPGTSICVGAFDAINLGWKLAAAIHGWAPKGLLDSYEQERRYGVGRAMMQAQAQVALRRGLDPAADALRELFQELLRDTPAQHRLAALIAHADLRYPLPGADPHPLAGTFVPNLALRRADDATTVAALMRAGRPLLLDLAGREDLREAASAWSGRVDVQVAASQDRPADVLLIRPDATIAWAAAIDAPGNAAALRAALRTWFGEPADAAR